MENVRAGGRASDSRSVVVAYGDRLERLEIAVRGPSFEPLVEMPFDQGEIAVNVGWHDLPRLVVEVKRSTALVHVLRDAAAELGVRAIPNDELPDEWRVSSSEDPPFDLPRLIGFFSPGDEASMRSPTTSGALTVLDANGGVHLVPFSQAPIGGLIDAHGEGLLEGDPRRPYLVLHPPGGGDFLFSDWQAFEQAARLAWDVGQKIGQFATVFMGLEWLASKLRRVGRANKAARAEAQQLAERGLNPHAVGALLATREAWETENVARLLACSISHAEGLLIGLGWRYDPSARSWHRDGDETIAHIATDHRVAQALASVQSRGLAVQVLCVGRALIASRSKQTRDQIVSLHWRIRAKWRG